MSELNRYKQATVNLIERLGCDYEVFTSANTLQEVEDAYFQAAEEGKREGFIPVLVVSDDTLEDYLGIIGDGGYEKEDVIASNVDGSQFLKERWKEFELYRASNYIGEEELIGDVDHAKGDELNHFLAFRDYRGDREVILFRIPVKNPWEVFAWLPMGGWNECLAAEELMAVAKYWYEQYGAVVATVSHDTLEFYVQNPVEDSEKAMELAKEMYAFCIDRVDQGVGTIAELYASIRKSHVWFFWWDKWW